MDPNKEALFLTWTLFVALAIVVIEALLTKTAHLMEHAAHETNVMSEHMTPPLQLILLLTLAILVGAMLGRRQ